VEMVRRLIKQFALAFNATADSYNLGISLESDEVCKRVGTVI